MHLSLGPWVWILHATNRGGAMGAGQGSTWWPILVVMAVGALLLVGRSRLGAIGRPGAVGLGMLIGGCLGNLLDRLLMGGVTDFISIRSAALGFVTINVADVFALIGTALAEWALSRTMGAADAARQDESAMTCDSKESASATNGRARRSAKIARAS